MQISCVERCISRSKLYTYLKCMFDNLLQALTYISVTIFVICRHRLISEYFHRWWLYKYSTQKCFMALHPIQRSDCFLLSSNHHSITFVQTCIYFSTLFKSTERHEHKKKPFSIKYTIKEIEQQQQQKKTLASPQINHAKITGGIFSFFLSFFSLFFSYRNKTDRFDKQL